jgi:hypothetical protein
MKYELWQDKLEDSYTFVEALNKNPSEEEQKRYKFLTADAKLITTFKADSFDDALVMRNKYLGWNKTEGIMKNEQSVFYIETFISAHDGAFPQGVASSLEKAIEFCEKKIQSGEGSHTDDPYENGGFVIKEFKLDNFRPETMKHYNDKGMLLEV